MDVKIVITLRVNKKRYDFDFYKEMLKNDIEHSSYDPWGYAGLSKIVSIEEDTPHE
jgi:hypothetical protein